MPECVLFYIYIEYFKAYKHLQHVIVYNQKDDLLVRLGKKVLNVLHSTLCWEKGECTMEQWITMEEDFKSGPSSSSITCMH